MKGVLNTFFFINSLVARRRDGTRYEDLNCVNFMVGHWKKYSPAEAPQVFLAWILHDVLVNSSLAER